MTTMLRTLLALAGVAFATHAAAQATFFEDEGYAGRSVNATQQIPAFERYGFNDRASSVVIVGERWEICQDSQFNGPCRRVAPGPLSVAGRHGPERPHLVGAHREPQCPHR